MLLVFLLSVSISRALYSLERLIFCQWYRFVFWPYLCDFGFVLVIVKKTFATPKLWKNSCFLIFLLIFYVLNHWPHLEFMMVYSDTNTNINFRYLMSQHYHLSVTNDFRCYHFYISHVYTYLGLLLDFSVSLNNVHKLVYVFNNYIFKIYWYLIRHSSITAFLFQSSYLFFHINFQVKWLSQKKTIIGVLIGVMFDLQFRGIIILMLILLNPRMCGISFHLCLLLCDALVLIQRVLKR